MTNECRFTHISGRYAPDAPDGIFQAGDWFFWHKGRSYGPFIDAAIALQEFLKVNTPEPGL